jgi:hypothetical protein
VRESVGECEAEADAVDEAGLLVEAAEVTGQVNDGILFLKGFASYNIQSARDRRSLDTKHFGDIIYAKSIYVRK